MTETRVYRIETGSLIVIPHTMTDEEVGFLADSISEVCGHRDFVVMLEPPEGTIEVIGSAEIIKGLEEQGVLQSSRST